MSRATNQQIAQGFAQGLNNFVTTYTKRKEEEGAQAVLENPNSTPTQKAIAWQKIAGKGGAKFHESLLNEDAAKKQSVNESFADQLISGRNPTQTQNPEMQNIEAPFRPPPISPIKYADEVLQKQAQEMKKNTFPGYKGFGSQQPNLQTSPEAEAQDELPASKQNRQAFPRDQEQEEGQTGGGYEVPTENLIKALGLTQDPSKKAMITAELKRRDTLQKGQDRKEAAEITAGQKALDKKIDRSLKINDSYNKRIADKKASAPIRMRAVDLAESAVRSGDVGLLSMNHIADVLDLPSLKNEQGAKLDLAIKTNLIGILSETAAKAQNIFLEKVVLDSFARPGGKQSSNLVKLLAVKTELQLQELETSTYDQILAQDIEQYGYEQPYIQMRVENALKPLQKEIIQSSAWKAINLEEGDKTYDELSKNALKNVSKGTPLTEQMGRILLDKAGGDSKKAAALADRLGYTIYSKEERMRYGQ
jgi:hypothetical protein